ncbi:hypothetical protein GP310_004436 [Salmonella enterica]|nr:hypothetical protein [Salmonella enterica subsp. enterica serovar Schwarzengrund]EBO8849310.1 hypothetical protein [Salmonella enterica subsp. enterica serovar Schwarzengrund]ECL6808658.1 hypothetical protein [Salmonella enterica subsp. enterica serovar Schwarzengrund]ECZ1395903.1 hypothetical protein [Salmonella enterica subsp. enterica serovar Schwarzengrund]EDG7506401.1 hypothetical protein [Salmonella enterica subsp. enterica serovar Schwarzengrund]
MPAFEWVHVQLHQQKGMISLSPPTICNSAAETASLAPFTTARPAKGTPGKGISRRTTKQTIIRAAVIRVRTGGKRE